MKPDKAREILELVRLNYQEIAKEFDVTRKKEIWPEIRKLAEEIKDGANILDLGCGNGRLIEALNDKKIDYLGVDSSLALIKIAQNNYPKKEFIEGDILDLGNVKNGCYDYVFCLATLQHIPGRELRLKALKKMAAKLNKDGEMIISNWNMWSSRKHSKQLIKNLCLKIIGYNQLEFNDLIFSWKNSRGEKKSVRYYHAFTKRELKKLAHQANLKILEIKKDKYNFWLKLKIK